MWGYRDTTLYTRYMEYLYWEWFHIRLSSFLFHLILIEIESGQLVRVHRRKIYIDESFPCRCCRSRSALDTLRVSEASVTTAQDQNFLATPLPLERTWQVRGECAGLIGVKEKTRTWGPGQTLLLGIAVALKLWRLLPYTTTIQLWLKAQRNKGKQKRGRAPRARRHKQWAKKGLLHQVAGRRRLSLWDRSETSGTGKIIALTACSKRAHLVWGVAKGHSGSEALPVGQSLTVMVLVWLARLHPVLLVQKLHQSCRRRSTSSLVQWCIQSRTYNGASWCNGNAIFRYKPEASSCSIPFGMQCYSIWTSNCICVWKSSPRSWWKRSCHLICWPAGKKACRAKPINSGTLVVCGTSSSTT